MSSSGLYSRILAPAEVASQSSEQNAVYLEVRPTEGGAIITHCLDGKRVMIGRGPNADFPLSGRGVSRYHAELQCDSRGLWWIQDLNSTNGTLVNGRHISTVTVINYGDAIAIGEFLLFLRPGGEELKEIAATTLRPPPAVLHPVHDASPHVDLNLEHSMATNRFVANLQHVANAERRRALLCEYAASEAFSGNFAAVVRLDPTGNATLLASRSPSRSEESAHFDEPTNSAQQEARSFLGSCHTHHRKLLTATGPVALEGAGRGRMIACPMDRTSAGVELFCVRIRASADAEEWLQLVSFLAEGVQRSDELWRLRDDIRLTAKLEYELTLANQIQQSLIPRSTRFKNLELSFSFNPSRSVGGDYVDFATLKDGRILLTCADVCGKGLQAALVTISVHTLVHVLVDVSNDLPSLVRGVNQHLYRYLPDHSFVTMLFVALDPVSGRIECINAGHPPALLLNVDGTLRALQSGKNVALGIMEFEPEAQRFTMGHNEILFMYTDGLSEARSPGGEILGFEALRDLCTRLVRSAPDAELELLRLRVEQAIKAYQSGSLMSDDSAFLLARLPLVARDATASSTTQPTLIVRPTERPLSA